MNERTKRVVIAAESEAFVMYLGILMRRLGFHIIPAESGPEVLQLTRIVTPDLIILDVTRPAVNGADVLKHLRGEDRLAHVPIIMAATERDHNTRGRCREFGCAAILFKPIRVLDLYNAVADIITWPGGKKRTHIRVPYTERVRIRGLGDERARECFALSLSEGGVYLRANHPLPVGTIVQVEFPTLRGGGAVFKGNVIYTKDVFGGLSIIDPGMAVQFSDLTSEGATLLKSFIVQALVGDLLEEQTEAVLSSDVSVSSP